MLALQISEGEWLTRRNLALLMIFPALTVVLVCTGSLHGLMRQNVYLDASEPFPVIAKTWGTGVKNGGRCPQNTDLRCPLFNDNSVGYRRL